jgi:hypothetical protein
MGDKAYALVAALVVTSIVFMLMAPVIAQDEPPDEEEPPSETPTPGTEPTTDSQTPGTPSEPTPGTEPAETEDTGTPGTLPDPASASASGEMTVVSVSENIPASTGGTVAVSVSGVSVAVNVLVVPPNAISENKTVTVTQTLPENPHTQVMVSNIFDIGPNGTTFNTPSTITLPYDENKIPSWTSEDDLAIYRRTSADDSWERIGGTVNKATNTVSAQIDHLSEYAVMVGTGGAGTGGLPTLTIAVIAVAISGAAVIALLIRRRGGKEEAWAEEVKQKHEGSGDTSIPAIRALFSAA